MKGNGVVKVEHISKKYCKSLKRSMLYGMNDITRNTLGLSSHPGKLRKGEFWAVDDVSIELQKGETLGIIGHNGAGKTTILKLLNGIFWPDKGKITVKGRTGALIAVGAGFHPMLSGRENIFINGAIMGMTKKEVDEKFHDIVDFADIGEFIDFPVKFYSSGMFVRLGFAIAAHCSPDILLIDEVMAVGDLDFQTKCFNRIGELMANGTTAVLVSHSMVHIQRICDRCLWLDSGKIAAIGNPLEITDAYQVKTIEELEKASVQVDKNDGLQIEKVSFLDQNGKKRNRFSPDEPISVEIYVDPKERVENPTFEIKLKSSSGIEILHVIKKLKISFFPGSIKVVKFLIDRLPLTNDIVHVNVLIWNTDVTRLFVRKSGIFYFKIISKGHLRGKISINYKFKVEENY